MYKNYEIIGDINVSFKVCGNSLEKLHGRDCQVSEYFWPYYMSLSPALLDRLPL